jgi:tetratricopeptide (TPR) repeat protein
MTLSLILAALFALPASQFRDVLAWQEERLRERQVLDPNSDDWADRPVASRPTSGGDLDRARELLARNEPKAARKLLEDWVEANAGDDRHLEGAFLLGEAWFESRNYWKAYENYEIVVEEGAGNLFFRALRREIDVARAFLSGEKRIVWGFLRLPAFDDGIQILDRVWERAPGTRLGEIALRLKADYFFEVGDVDLAQDEYALLAREYPSGRYVQIAMLRSAEAANAAFPGVRFDDKPLVEADERYAQLKKAFPAYAERQGVDARMESVRQARAAKDLEIGKWYEKTRQAGAAEYYYRLVTNDWPDTIAAAEALERLRALGAEPPPSPSEAGSP